MHLLVLLFLIKILLIFMKIIYLKVWIFEFKKKTIHVMVLSTLKRKVFIQQYLNQIKIIHCICYNTNIIDCKIPVKIITINA